MIALKGPGLIPGPFSYAKRNKDQKILKGTDYLVACLPFS
jgi:hypothetical protein